MTLGAIPAASQFRRRPQGFTLAEMQVSLAVIVLIVVGVFASHLLGLKLNEMTRAKLNASEAARNTIARLVDDIRAAKLVEVGTGNFSTFTAAPSGSAQQGSAIRIYSTTNMGSYVVYYRDAAEAKLKRATNSANTPIVVGQFITNSVVFTAEDYRGNTLTDHQNNRVIALNLQFYQIQYPISTVGRGGLYDYYQLRTKITRRTLE